MTGKSDFSEEDWKLVLEAPPSARLIDPRELLHGEGLHRGPQEHGESELLDEIVSAKPEMDHTRFHSPDELKNHGLQKLRDAVAVLEQKATPEEVEEYRRFVIDLARRVAEAHKEGFMGLSGERVSEAEREAIEKIAQALGT